MAALGTRSLASAAIDRTGAIAVACAALLLATVAQAQTAAPEAAAPACPAGNLLSPGRLSAVVGVEGNATLLTDGAAAAEGAIWNAPQAVVLSTGQSSITWDLGAVTRIGAALVQGDANDTYSVSVSDDGHEFRPVWLVPSVLDLGHGLRTRAQLLRDVSGRFVRIGTPMGDLFYSLAEVEAFCDVPSPWPPSLRVAADESAPPSSAKPTTLAGRLWEKLAGSPDLTLDQANAIKMVLALYGAALLLLGLWIGRERHGDAVDPARAPVLWFRRRWFVIASFVVAPLAGLAAAAAAPLEHGKIGWSVLMFVAAEPAAAALGLSLYAAASGPIFAGARERLERTLLPRFRDGLLALLGLIGLTGYYNWGHYHFTTYIHHYEFFHYFVGSKYFSELGYTRLYQCSLVAESELATDRQDFERQLDRRKIRDLERNILVPAGTALEDPDRCKKNFSAERWARFEQDIAYFRTGASAERWDAMLQDHGYNPSPLWTMTGSLLANRAPASRAFIGFGNGMRTSGPLGLLDPLCLGAAFAAIGWAFGWRTLCVALLFFGTNQPALYFWTGGAYLRQDWFAAAMVGLALVKRGYPMLGGAGLAYSTLLRVFPGGFFIAPAMKLAWTLWKERRVDRTGLRIFLGAALATAILVPASSAVSGGFGAWPAFVANSAKHASTPLTNYMGLSTVVSFRPSNRQEVAVDRGLDDPYLRFKELHNQSFRRSLPIFLALLAGLGWLVLRAARSEAEWWAVAALGFAIIPAATELTCYYYSFLTAAALFSRRRPEIAAALLATAAATHAIAFATHYYDVRYTIESVAVLAFATWAVWRLTPRRAP